GAAALLAGRGFEHPDAIFKALNDSARDIDILGFDNKTGNGLLQIDAALGCQMTSPTGPSGGSYQCEPFCLELPAGMLDGDATLRISTFTHFAAAPAHYLPLGAYAEITLDPKPIPPLIPAPRVCYRYTAADLVKVGGRPENLHFAVYTPETQFWQRLATSVDRQAQRIYSDVPHFSIFGVFYTPMPETPPVTGAHFPAAPAGWLLAALGGAGAFWIWRSLRSRRA
ncbi:MAG: hypothetical protein U1B80_01075, partial [Anaerolineaceae bacterium]|nr:hypothetical protein [Anaerolineaceae bacterium]